MKAKKLGFWEGQHPQNPYFFAFMIFSVAKHYRYLCNARNSWKPSLTRPPTVYSTKYNFMLMYQLVQVRKNTENQWFCCDDFPSQTLPTFSIVTECSDCRQGPPTPPDQCTRDSSRP